MARKSKITKGCEAVMKMLLCPHRWGKWRRNSHGQQTRTCLRCKTRETIVITGKP